MERITSRSNPLIAHVRKLASDGEYRQDRAAFLCDGPKLLEEALRWNGGVSMVLVSEGVDLPPVPEGIRVIQIPEGLMRSLAPTKTPQGVLSVCSLRRDPLPERLDGRRYLLLDAMQDPGNVGTILRTADAFGADGVFLLPGCADRYGPRTVRSSAGALFRLPVWSCAARDAAALLRRSGVPLFGAAAREDAKDVREADLTRFAAAVGNEGQGLSDEVLSLCVGTVRIPMEPGRESLNAAMAAGVLLWEAARDEHRGGGPFPCPR